MVKVNRRTKKKKCNINEAFNLPSGRRVKCELGSWVCFFMIRNIYNSGAKKCLTDLTLYLPIAPVLLSQLVSVSYILIS